MSYSFTTANTLEELVITPYELTQSDIDPEQLEEGEL
jgi:hypothetical protein